MTRSTNIRPDRRLPGFAPVLAATILLGLGADSVTAQRPYPPEMEGTTSEVYRTAGDVELRMYFCNPEGHSAGDQRPAIVFFFGGGWRAGSPQQFLPHCRYLAERGMVAAVADYRVARRHGVTAHECVEDAKSAVRWLRANADRLGVDPDRIAAGGGSAGGHLAASTATLPGHDDPAGDKSISSKPNALALFNPGTVLASVPGRIEFDKKQTALLAERAGAEPKSISPYHHVMSGFPPAIIFHGKADTTVPYKTVEVFTEKVKSVGSRCELVGYEGANHGFFNYGRGDGSAYTDTVGRMDKFFVSLGWLGPSE
jgi:acetyl esterase/lipase